MADNVTQILSDLGARLQAQSANVFGNAVDAFTTQKIDVASLRAQPSSLNALQYENDFVGASTTNIPDSNFNASTYTNDFDRGPGPQRSSSFNFGGENGTARTWNPPAYAVDTIAHQPKFKFLFKVKFEGTSNTFYYYVINADKPKVRFEHQEVNYYNFRTKVLTKMNFEPLSLTFWDEIGNSANAFFVEYMNKHSGQGSGGADIDAGMGSASSSYPYEKTGYSSLKKITIEQIFANGVASNRFHFWNPRIESFDFDSLAMEDNSGSLVTIQFNFDALTCETVDRSTIHSWGTTDIHGGGDTDRGGALSPTSAFEDGGSISGQDPIDYREDSQAPGETPGTTSLESISDLLPTNALQNLQASVKDPISSTYTTISQSIRDTIANTNNNFYNPSAPAPIQSLDTIVTATRPSSGRLVSGGGTFDGGGASGDW